MQPLKAKNTLQTLCIIAFSFNLTIRLKLFLLHVFSLIKVLVQVLTLQTVL